jgi:hypothetical protein
VSPDGLLKQCSSMSDWVAAHHTSEEWQLPGSYLELVERAVLPEFAHLEASAALVKLGVLTVSGCDCGCGGATHTNFGSLRPSPSHTRGT